MRFFITEDERKRTGSTAFIEFQKGRFDGECWHIDSICMDEDKFYELHLRRLFSMTLPQFDYYGITQVSGEEFKRVVEASADFSDNNDVAACIGELKEWIGEAEDEDILFTICGM
ncbi:MAG: hypothetical protein IKW90_12800 [Lachnospiraceae bacterium]|nr:hypothetical protein [Lachnospiraceae bacterium]